MIARFAAGTPARLVPQIRAGLATLLMAWVGSLGCSGSPGPSPSTAREPRRGDAETTGIRGLAEELAENLRHEGDALLKVAVTELTTTDGAACPGQARIAESLTTELFRTGRFDLVERRQLERVLRELEMSTSDLLSPESGARLGRIMGAMGLVTGTLTRTSTGYRVNARVVLVESAEVVSVGSCEIHAPALCGSAAQQAIPRPSWWAPAPVQAAVARPNEPAPSRRMRFILTGGTVVIGTPVGEDVEFFTVDTSTGAVRIRKADIASMGYEAATDSRAGLVGWWTGRGCQGNGACWTIDLRIDGVRDDMVIGTIAYPSLGCEARLECVRWAGAVAVFRERYFRRGRCEPDGWLWLGILDPSTLSYQWAYPNGTIDARTRVTRVR